MISLLILSLPLGASLIWLLPGEYLARWVALFIALIDLLLAVTILLAFDPGQSGFQFVEQSNWISSLNIHYRIGVDGISVLFLPLTVLLFLGVVLSSWSSTRSMPRLYYTLLLL
ncbi:NADH-quinone oxidoreductase subunit M, partial [Candidatus Endoriftia persephone str. Guaymas]|nr:NADH-quinone oxidoreductase subunit M [Candidatus Endoriftia persephone str. Guaymas]